jgi:catechol 2,3-dioxygenase-like lactoylglutathione lyase family enzyme
MIDHVELVVTDIGRSTSFYERALAPLGMKRLMSYGGADGAPAHVGFGQGQKPDFWLGTGDHAGGYAHVALAADTRQAVDEFHAAAIAAGGRDNGAPGLRPQYHPGYYGAFVLDPDGFNVEAVHHSFPPPVDRS